MENRTKQEGAPERKGSPYLLVLTAYVIGFGIGLPSGYTQRWVEEAPCATGSQSIAALTLPFKGTLAP